MGISLKVKDMLKMGDASGTVSLLVESLVASSALGIELATEGVAAATDGTITDPHDADLMKHAMEHFGRMTKTFSSRDVILEMEFDQLVFDHTLLGNLANIGAAMAKKYRFSRGTSQATNLADEVSRKVDEHLKKKHGVGVRDLKEIFGIK